MSRENHAMSRVRTGVETAEFTRRGNKLYEQQIKPRVEPVHVGRFIAIDVDSGDYEIADDRLTASENLQSRRPKTVAYLRRVGYPFAVQFGGSSLEKLWSAESKTTGVNDTMATTHLDEQLLEILRKADAVYNRDIRRDVEPQHNGEHIALDVESGDYELDSSESAARERLCARRPDARVAMGRIGSSFLTNLGPSIRILP